MECPSTTDTGRGPSACAAGATPRKVRWLRTFSASPRTRTRSMNDLLGSTAIGTTPALDTMVRPVTAGMSLEKVAVTSTSSVPSGCSPTIGKLAMMAPVSVLLMATSIGRSLGSRGAAPGTATGGTGPPAGSVAARRFCTVLMSRTCTRLPTRSRRASALPTSSARATTPAGTPTTSVYQSSGLPSVPGGSTTRVLPPLRKAVRRPVPMSSAPCSGLSASAAAAGGVAAWAQVAAGAPARAASVAAIRVRAGFMRRPASGSRLGAAWRTGPPAGR